MNERCIGIEATSGITRVAQVAVVGGSSHRITLQTIEAGGRFTFSPDTPQAVRLVVDDDRTIVRLVQTAGVEPTLAESAARYEAEAALLSRQADFCTSVQRISQLIKAETWLASSIHRPALHDLASAMLADYSPACPIGFAPRSVALGLGYLRACATPTNPSVVVVQPAGRMAAICFICQGAIVGTARLRGIDILAVDESECDRWISELTMLMQYRLGADLAGLFGSIHPDLVLAAEIESVNRLNARSPMKFAPATITLRAESPTSAELPVTPEWLAPLGAAFN